LKQLPRAVERFVLHWGDMGGQWGLNRSVAQIQALLYLSERPMTAEDIADALGLARSNVSNSIKELLGWNLIRRVPIKGDRRDHFEAETDIWEMFMRISAGGCSGSASVMPVCFIVDLPRRAYGLLDRVRHVGAGEPEQVGDILGGEREVREIQQCMDLADRAVDPPPSAEVAPMEHEPFDRHGKPFSGFCYFCHNRNIGKDGTEVK